MFTGIIAAIGRIEKIQAINAEVSNVGSADQQGIQLIIHAGSLDLSDVQVGDSIAIQGACMTVTALSSSHFEVQVSRESLNRTTGLAALGEVNLEKALRLADRLGGHLVSGHVDGLACVENFRAIAESWLLQLRVPSSLAKYLVYKGSITVNGVSLTVNHVKDMSDDHSCIADINLIPHTLQATTLKHLQSGDAVNIEVDLIARYCERMLSYQNTISS